MKIPLQVTFRDFPHSDAVEANIREKAQKLDQFSSDLLGRKSAIPASRSALGARRNIRDFRTDGEITRIARESELR